MFEKIGGTVARLFGAALLAAALLGWQGKYTDVQVTPKLETTQYQMEYGGSVTQIDYKDEAPAGSQFVLVRVALDRTEEAVENLNGNDVQLKIGGKSYTREAEDDFLNHHNYSPLPHGSIMADTAGYVLFIVPDKDANSSQEGWTITANGVELEKQAEGEIEDDGAYLTQKQSEIENAILKEYKNSGKKTLEDPYVILDPYGTAPLSAVAMFETNEAASIEVAVAGKPNKAANADIHYTVDGTTKHHEVQIFGLYANYANKVTLTARNANGGIIATKEITVKTAPLPADIVSDKKIVTRKVNRLDNDLIAVDSTYRMVIDNNCDIRWITNMCAYFSGVTLYENGSLWFTDEYYQYKRAVVYHMDYLGKILGEYHNLHPADHDAVLLPNKHLIYISNPNTVYDLNTVTGEEKVLFHYNDLMKPTGNENVRDNTYHTDWMHLNTVTYETDDRGNTGLMFSGRHQSMIFWLNYDANKTSYTAADVKWVFAPNVNGHPEFTGKYFTPDANDSGFEWFYMQHDSKLLGNIDGNPNTIDLLLFDNGIARSLDKNYDASAPMYSRIVHYRLNLKTMKATQVYDAGADPIYYSESNGSVQKLKNGNYTGLFNVYQNNLYNTDTTDDLPARYLEFDGKGDILMDVSFNESIYRAERYDIQTFVIPKVAFGKTKGVSFYNEQRYFVPTNEYSFEEKGKQKVDVVRMETIDGRLFVVLKVLNTAGTPVASTFNVKLLAYNGVSQYVSPDLTSAYPTFAALPLELDYIQAGSYELAALIYNTQGNLVGVRPLNKTLRMGDTTVVGNTDIFATQKLIDQQIDAAVSSGSYTLHNPYVTLNPYGISPLTALIGFNTDKNCTVDVKVLGSRIAADTMENHFENLSKSHLIPVYGLYGGKVNQVEVKVKYANGTTDTQIVEIKTEPVPAAIPVQKTTVHDASRMVKGLNFIIPGNNGHYTRAADSTGAIRWYLSNTALAYTGAIRVMQNGHFLVESGEVTTGYYKSSMYEMDLLGKVYHEYMLDTIHHDFLEMPNGNILVTTNNIDGVTDEDFVYEIDGKTGAILHFWDFKSILGIEPVADATYHNPNNPAKDEEDWLHINSIAYDPSDNSLLVSGRMQDIIFKMDMATGEIKWIISDPNDEWPEHLKERLLTMVDQNGNVYGSENFDSENNGFQYGQHNVTVLSNGDVMCFDNGNFRTKDPNAIGDANVEGYSRAVVYHVDPENMTVQQVYQYGKQNGWQDMATYISGSQELDAATNHYLVNFGGILRLPDGTVTYDQRAYFLYPNFSSASAQYEVIGDEVIFEARVETARGLANMYRVSRINPYTTAEEHSVKTAGTRLSATFDYKTAVKTTMPTSPLNMDVSGIAVADNGVSLTVNATADEKAVGDLYLYLSGKAGIYKQLLVSGSNTVSAFKMLDSNVPAGDYSLYLVREADGKSYSKALNLNWHNGVTAQARPKYYSIDVAVESGLYGGQVFGGGKQFMEKTGATVYAIPDVGYRFIAWKDAKGNVVSEDAVYSFVPSRNTKLYASFELENADQLLKEGIYTITMPYVKNGNLVGVENGSMADGAALTYKAANGSNAQQFYVSYLGCGLYSITNVNSGKALDVCGASDQAGAPVWQWSINGGNQQKWYLQAVNGGFTLQSANSRLYLTCSGGQFSQQARMDNNQVFSFVPVEYVQSLEDGTYYIHTALDDNRVLDIYGLSNENGGNLNIWNKNNSPAQKFQLHYVGFGMYELKTSSGRLLDVCGASTEKGANIWQWADNKGTQQRWYLQDAGKGYYNIINVNSGMLMNVEGDRNANGANVWQWQKCGAAGERFRFEKVEYTKTIEDGIYTIGTALDKNVALDIYGYSNENGANLNIWKRNSSVGQRFRVTYLEQDNAYQITALCSGKALDIQGNGMMPGSNVWQWNNYAGDNQKWYIAQNNDNSFSIISKSSGLYLDICGNNAANGTNVWTWAGNNTAGQKFTFTPVTFDSDVKDGVYSIKSALNENLVLSARNDNIQIDQNVMSAGQQFSVKRQADGTFTLVDTMNGKALTAAGEAAGANIVLMKNKGENSQKWYIVKSNDGNYSFVNYATGLLLDVAGNKGAAGQNVHLWAENGVKGQKFALTPVSYEAVVEDGTYFIITKQNRMLVAEIAGVSLDNGGNLDLWEPYGGNGQKFVLTHIGNGQYTMQVKNSGKFVTLNAANNNLYQWDWQDTDYQKWYIVNVDKDLYQFVSAANGMAWDIEGGKADYAANLYASGNTSSESQMFILHQNQKAAQVMSYMAEEEIAFYSELEETVEGGDTLTEEAAEVQEPAEDEEIADEEIVSEEENA